MFKENFNLQYDKYKEMIVKMRGKIDEMLSGSLNVDRLMKDKVEDYILLEEQPLPITVGNRTIFIGNFTFSNEHLFFNEWAEIISAMGSKIINMELAEERRKELLEKSSFNLLAEGSWMYEFLTMDKWLFDRLCKLINKTVLKQQAYYLTGEKVRKKLKWKNCNLRYFKKNITKEKLIQICYLIYFYNFDSVKKNAQIIMERMNMKALGETHMYSCLQNLVGSTGKLAAAQAPSIDYAFRDVKDKPIPANHMPKKPLTTHLDSEEIMNSKVTKEKDNG
jgi:hypothetical protein